MKSYSTSATIDYPSGSLLSEVIAIAVTDEGKRPEEAKVFIDSCLFGPPPEDPTVKRGMHSAFFQETDEEAIARHYLDFEQHPDKWVLLD